MVKVSRTDTGNMVGEKVSTSVSFVKLWWWLPADGLIYLGGGVGVSTWTWVIVAILELETTEVRQRGDISGQSAGHHQQSVLPVTASQLQVRTKINSLNHNWFLLCKLTQVESKNNEWVWENLIEFLCKLTSTLMWNVKSILLLHWHKVQLVKLIRFEKISIFS